ncbi:hypothetical protein [Lactococcus lactis]|uniref:hypothetical protein n=1 Tax=Lactococcus lactis TaxID=1358 RepID=UPI00241611C5|nr:hypothetical protein [Lactococcus lactis]MDG4956012.1 hypothetical protein [Lactococcus lactis]
MKPITIKDLAQALKVNVGVLLVLCQVNGIEAEDENAEITLEQSAFLTQALKENSSVVASTEPEQRKKKKSIIPFSEKKPKVDKKKWEKKKKENDNQEPLKNQTYEKSVIPKGYNQKWSNRIFIGLIAGVVLLSVGSGVSYLQAKNHVHSEANKIVQSDKEQIQKMSNGQSSQNYKAQIFLNDFVKSYFNVPSDGKEQENYQKFLLAFYGQDLPVASQGQQKNPSDLESYELMDITNSTATYLVTYTTHTKEDVPASKGKKESVKTVTHTNSTLFKISYGTVKGKYYVSSFPTFEDVTSLNAGKSAPLLTMDAVTNLSKSKENQLNTFVKSLLEAKTKNQETLDLLADGLTLSSNEELVSVDYTNFQQKGKDTYKAIVQATFKNDMGTHPENYVFTITKTNKTFFARDFTNVITAKDMETMKG